MLQEGNCPVAKICPVCGWVWEEADRVCRGCLLLASAKGLRGIERLKGLVDGWPRIALYEPKEDGGIR